MEDLYFKEPRLILSAPGEFLVRLLACSFHVVLIASALVLLYSGETPLEYIAVLISLFLVDRLIHLGEGEKDLSEIGEHNKNLAEAITPGAHHAVSRAFRRAYVVGQNFHFLLLEELAEKKDVREILRRFDIREDEFLAKIGEFLSGNVVQVKPTKADILKEISALSLSAYGIALGVNEKFIEPRNLFAALSAMDNPALRTFFNFFDIRGEDIQLAAAFGRYRRLFGRLRFLPAVLGGFAHKPRFLRHRTMNRSWTARPTPTLDQFSRDLTDLAREERIGFLVGHKKEFGELIQVISRPGKPNAILVGDPGAGKSSMVAHLAFRMVKDEVPPVLFDKRLVSLEINRIVSNATGDVLSGRVQKIAEEILRAGNVVLFIPNMHDLFRTAETESLNAIDVLLPVIKDNAIPVVGESYPREFKQFIEPRSDFMEQFEVVNVNEISEEDAVRFLTYESMILEKEYGIFITYRAVREAVTLAHRYLRSRPLPGSAANLLKLALTDAKENRKKILKAESISAVAEKLARIPIQKAGKPEVKKLLNLEQIIHEKFVNQDIAVRSVSQSLREYRSGISRKGGPIASFLFVGPTGVGKTELAKVLAKIQFGSKEAMERFDMSEYQDKSSVFRLIGNPDGSRTGSLTDAVLQKPFSLVLLDEFEKAHPDILNIFLQVLDDGRLTDSLNRTVSFENTIIIATSNAHSEFIKSETEKGRTGEEISTELKKKLTDHFKPELLNRFSDVIVFRNLSPEEIASVVGFMLDDLVTTLQETNGVRLSWDKPVADELVRLGYSKVFGARPLRQVIADKIRSVLAEKLLKEEVRRGDEVKISFSGGKFDFTSNVS